MGFDVPPVVGIGPSEHPLDVDRFPLGIAVFVAEPDVSGQLARLDGEMAGVDVAPGGPFAAHLLQRGVGVGAVVEALSVGAVPAFGASVAAVGPGLPPLAFAGLEKRAPSARHRRPFLPGAGFCAVRAGVPAVLRRGVVDDLAVDRGSGFAQQLRGLGQGQPLGDGGLEVDPVVVPQSLFHLFFVLSLRWGCGEGHDSQKPEKEEKEGQGGRAVAITQSSNRKPVFFLFFQLHDANYC